MSALDDVIRLAENYNLSERYHWIGDGVPESARAELSRLRAAASEADALRAELDKWRTWKPDDEDLRSLAEQAMKRDGSHSDSLAACWAYIRGLEAWLRDHDALRAERDRLRAEYDAEAAEFNAGFDAYRAGTPVDDEPHDTKYDQWRCGWAWAAFETLRATVAEQARQIENALTTIDGQAAQLRDATDLIRRVWEMADNETSTIEIDNTSQMWQIEADTRAWLAANAPTPAQEAEQPALLTEDGYFTNCPTEDEMPAPEAEQERAA